MDSPVYLIPAVLAAILSGALLGESRVQRLLENHGHATAYLGCAALAVVQGLASMLLAFGVR